MRVLDRYIIKTVLGAVALVTAILLVLIGLFLFIGQQGEVGTGTYSSLDALWFVVLNMPEQLFEFLPIGGLIGTLLGLGTLARGSELTVMRAAGISVLRIGLSLAMAGLLLTVVAAVVGEFIAPSLGQMAREYKAFAKFSNVSFAGQGGAWVRDGDLILKAEQQSGDGAFGGFMVFDLSPDNRLLGIGRATSAVEQPGEGWNLNDYTESRFEGDQVVSRQEASRRLTTRVSAGFLGVAAADPTRLSVRALRNVVAYLGNNAQDTRIYQFALWSRIAKVCAIFFAVLLALPFVFGSLRSSGAGARMTLGLVLGMGYFLLEKMVESGTVAFGLDPVPLAWAPTAVLAALVSVLVLRLR
ncbi:MAG: LPS export ABC transporter permease LptG [Pseudomonadota bacterium]